MGVKNYNGSVSGYLDPDGRNWESVPFQSGKPVLDKELNLLNDLANDTERITRIVTSASGFNNSDVFLKPNPLGFFTISTVPNELIVNFQQCQVNGWDIFAISTNTSLAKNNLDLGAGPAGAGARRFDIVVLEVWRRLLSASPSTVGKSATGRIWYFGNVKIAPADDLALNFADDILDGAVGTETTKRVQIQYRLRVIQDVDLFAYPYGIDDPGNVFAHSVPAAPAAPDGVATLFNYTNQSGFGPIVTDPGMWRAGDGVPTNTLGTVDGYMYAVPVCAVVRRNTTAFDRNTNHNGGVATPGPSDRPDGFFYDIIEERDVIDLRMAVNPNGWDYNEILSRNINWLLDNEIRTEIGSTLVGGGVDGTTVLSADEIGITNANGGDGVTTGDTPGANFIGQFDAVLRRFSDRSQVELAVLRYFPADGSGGGPNWANNDVITIDPTALPVYQEGAAFNWAAYAPSAFSFVDIDQVAFIGTGGAETVALPTDAVATGLGAVPQGSVSYDIGTVPLGITDEPLYIFVMVEYPKGLGLTSTPTDDFPDSLYINNPAQLPAAAPVLFEAVDGFALDWPHREANITYRTVSHTFTTSPFGPTTILVPERILSVSAILINAVPYLGPFTIFINGYGVVINPVLVPGDTIDITYKSIRPFPQNDEQVTVYYESRVPQTGREALIGVSQHVIPRAISQHVYSLTVGSGSHDEAYPFPYQYVQPGGVYPTSGGTFSGDHELDGRALITVTDFEASTGYLKLPALVDYVPSPNEATFTRAPGDKDAEGRTFFKTVTAPGYVPNAHAQELSDPKRHKNLVPFLAELTVDSPLGFRGQLVLMVLSRWVDLDAANSVFFDATLASNRTTASIYRVQGLLINRRPL